MSHVFAHGQLRLYLLALLEESPCHGYEVIRELERRFDGMYSPSAGTIYPRLSRLEEEGLVSRSDEGRKAVYRITADGRAELARRRPEIDQLEVTLTRSVRRLAQEVQAAVAEDAQVLRAELSSAAQDARRRAVDPEGDHLWQPDDDPAPAGPAGDVDNLLKRFRHEARRVLRAGGVDESTVGQVRSALDEALRRIERALHDAAATRGRHDGGADSDHPRQGR